MDAAGHLSSAGDERLTKLLASMGWVDEIDRLREFDAAATRIRPMLNNIYTTKEHALLLGYAFTVRSQQTQVLAAVHDITPGACSYCAPLVKFAIWPGLHFA
jgi:hypothetical protein